MTAEKVIAKLKQDHAGAPSFHNVCVVGVVGNQCL